MQLLIKTVWGTADNPVIFGTYQDCSLNPDSEAPQRAIITTSTDLPQNSTTKWNSQTLKNYAGVSNSVLVYDLTPYFNANPIATRVVSVFVNGFRYHVSRQPNFIDPTYRRGYKTSEFMFTTTIDISDPKSEKPGSLTHDFFKGYPNK